MGLVPQPPSDSLSPSHLRARRAFLLSSYLLLGAASGCAFLTLSLRLIPSVYGFLLIILHAVTIVAAVYGCSTIAGPSPPSGRWYALHMVFTVIAAILQGAVAVLVFSRTSDFLLDTLKSYVREEDGVVIMRMVGGLGVAIFCLEWVGLALAFVMRYYAYVDRELGGVRSSKVGADASTSNWPWVFQA